MGFTTGFTGGVTLTLSLAYLTMLAHQRNREHQASILRQQTYAISGLYDPLPPTLPPTRAELAALERRNLVDTAKDRWNAEVEGAVRWAQTKDWEGVRERLEAAVGNVWARALGRSVAVAEAEAAELHVSEAAARARAEVQEKVKSGVAAVKDQSGAEARTGGVLEAVSRGLEKGRDAISNLGKATTAAESKADDKLEEKLSGLSPEERIITQRYLKPRPDDRSPEEIIAERYLPTDRRDNKEQKLKAF
ncbi:hypothetical protein DL770_002127 [Monosporascus sp. CRB-9-2]|nr:hypothetical protein DL770_002127 [Monosporascus sp. CRB-9-2]